MVKKIKKAVLKQELQAMKRDGRVYTLDLADLVMMQMAGNFPDFIESLPHNGTSEKDLGDALALIEETRAGVTTEKLFPSIVQKTIEAQFGDKHAALRELGQNGIDSYSSGDVSKDIVFDVSTTPSHIILRVRDYGVGMDAQSLVRDLLIPYNSGKEFDLTKIGEHGIGWYSVVDLADVVRVVSRPPDSEDEGQAVGALVYHDGTWKASILPHASNGFTPRLHKEHSGTEVTAFIDKKGETSIENLRAFLYQYLGMVSEVRANIVFRNGEHAEKINSLRALYETAAPVELALEGETQPLRIRMSKRLLGGTGDSRFTHRDKNLEKVLFTQQGLFI